MIRPILIGPEEVQRAKEVVAYAEEHRVNLKTLLRRQANDCDGLGENRKRRMQIPCGVSVVFSIEEHPAGWCRHLSIALYDPEHKKCIDVTVAPLIMQLFGMRGDSRDCQAVYCEECVDCLAINLIQDYDAGSASGEQVPRRTKHDDDRDSSG